MFRLCSFIFGCSCHWLCCVLFCLSLLVSFNKPLLCIYHDYRTHCIHKYIMMVKLAQISACLFAGLPGILPIVYIFMEKYYYRNDPKFSDRQAWANSADPDQTAPSLIRVYTVCHSVCIVWTHYCMVKPHSSNFRVITTICLGVRIFRKFTVHV